jgi:hypothetical protein
MPTACIFRYKPAEGNYPGEFIRNSSLDLRRGFAGKRYFAASAAWAAARRAMGTRKGEQLT